MGVLSPYKHEFWATVSGGPIAELLRQEAAAWEWGVSGIEFRADLIAEPDFAELLMEKASDSAWAGPTFVAHFGVGGEAKAARDAIERSLATPIAGAICHSRCELIDEVQAACADANRHFAAAYHSQQPMTAEDAMAEFERQELRRPLFRKIAVRAYRVEDVLALLRATHVAAQNGGSPVVAAVFGPHRWARVALPNVGSVISFLVTRQAANEVGADDEQLQLAEADRLQLVRGVYPSRNGRVQAHTNRIAEV